MKKQVSTLGIILLIWGCLWLAKDMGWIRINIPWMPLIVIGIGAWLIYRKKY